MAQRTHCFRGHEFTADNVIAYRGSGGVPKRKCRTCALEAMRRRNPPSTGTKGVGGGMDQIERFMRQVMPVPIAGCWLWTGAQTGEGYGQVMFDGRRQVAHRVSARIFLGGIPAGMFVLHRCDTPACVNPSHLFFGTLSDNSCDRERKGRGVDNRGESHPKAILTDEAVRYILASNETASDLANRFRVNRETIYTVRHRRTWRHVQI